MSMKTKESAIEVLPFNLRFPELFRDDVSIYPSYTNLKVPYRVICRERKNKYISNHNDALDEEIKDLSLQQVYAWDGVRIARIFDKGYRKRRHILHQVHDPLTVNERRKLYALLDA